MGNLDKSAASSYVYARASGLLSKSFVGANANRLFSVQSLRELYTLLFDSEIPSVPEVMLAKEIEVKATENFITLYKSLLSEFESPSPILSEILSFYDYENSEVSDSESDKARILALWKAVSSLRGSDRANLEQLYKMEISFKNILWVLRLKVYYHFTNEEIMEQLVFSGEDKKKDDELARDAIAILGKVMMTGRAGSTPNF